MSDNKTYFIDIKGDVHTCATNDYKSLCAAISLSATGIVWEQWPVSGWTRWEKDKSATNGDLDYTNVEEAAIPKEIQMCILIGVI